jgi:hypothetical protein
MLTRLLSVVDIEIVPVPNRDVDEDAMLLVAELRALGHDAHSRLDVGAHAGIALAIRILDAPSGIAGLEEQVREALGEMRRRREQRDAPREVAALFGPDGSALLEVEI